MSVIVATQAASALRFFSMKCPPATPAPAVCRFSYVARIHSRPRSSRTKKQLPKSRQVPHPPAAGCCKSLLLGRLLGSVVRSVAASLYSFSNEMSNTSIRSVETRSCRRLLKDFDAGQWNTKCTSASEDVGTAHDREHKSNLTNRPIPTQLGEIFPALALRENVRAL